MFGFFSACAVIFEYFYVAETKGLSEREKKGLYCPGAPYGRRLSPREEPIKPPSPTNSMFSDMSHTSNFRALDARWQRPGRVHPNNGRKIKMTV